jgi:putative protease
MVSSPVCELCAPAGSLDSFQAAIDGGANAVYLGLTDFNARLRARNFTAKTLSHLVPLAHKHDVKVYVTLNTLIKQAELEGVVHTLYQIDQLGVDAAIVADLGLIRIARQQFPRLRLHASTQAAVHNSAGAGAMQRLGCSRAVVARELTFEELRAMQDSAAIELEVFVHGALCYCISGLCLASSFLGGASGNRGRCTQACRRKFGTGTGQGYYFSPRDLSLADFLPHLRKLGIAALKIEGRMKNAAYVYKTVSAYRRLLDGDTSPAPAELLDQDLCRPKTSFFFKGREQPGVIDAIRSGVGRSLGHILRATDDCIVLPPETDVSAGDRIRIDPQSGFEGVAADVRSVAVTVDGTRLRLKKAVACSAGEAVYLVARKNEDSLRPAAVQQESSLSHAVAAAGPHMHFPLVKQALADYSAAAATQEKRQCLWIRTDSLAWLDHLMATPCQRIILACGPVELKALLGDATRLRIWKSRIVLAPPPFIAEDDLGRWRKLLDEFHAAGIRQGMCSNPGHATLFGKRFELIADASLWCLNREAQRALKEMGFNWFTYSWEDDYLNIKAAASARGLAYLYSYVPLFVSRIRPAVRPGRDFSDPHDNKFFTGEKDGLHYMLARKPLCLTGRKDKLIALGIRNFIFDLSFCKVDPELLATLLRCYGSGERVPETSMFNFKAGLR